MLSPGSPAHRGNRAQKVHDILVPVVGPILAKSVFECAVEACYATLESFEREGISRCFVAQIEEGLRVFGIPPGVQQEVIGQLLALPSDLFGSGKPQLGWVVIHVSVEEDVVLARMKIGTLLENLAFDTTTRTKVVTAVSEVARNIQRYAGQGVIRASVVNRNGRSGVSIVATDQGPGIPHLPEVLGGRYQSKTGMGLGILGCKRLMDEFEITSIPGQGTRIVMTKFKR